MASFNPLAMILNQKPLDGNNFEDWKTNLYIVLDYEKIKFVLDTPKPAIPEASANDITKTEHVTWENANTSLRCYILANVVGHLRQQITPLDSGVEMLQILEGMFAKSTAFERQAAITDLINTRMTGERVKDHCLAMISHISRAEVMGAKLQQEMKIDLILQSLPKHFNQFKVNYNMHKMDLTPVQLMHELESVEQSLTEPGSINFTEGSVKPKGKPKGGNENKKKKAVIPVTKSYAMKKPKGKCFKCGQKGHWKQNCPKATKKPSIGDLLVVEACLVENFNDKWIIDSGATNHVCYSLQLFKHSTFIGEGQRYLKLRNGELISIKAIGPVVLFFENNRTLCLEDCLFVPDFKRNFVSVGCLVEHGLTLQFNSSVSIRSKSFFICSGDIINNLYFLSPLSYDINVIEIVENEHNHLDKKRKVSNETYFWHLRLGHINPNRIHVLVRSGILNSLAFEPIPMCESCLEGKMPKRPFKAKRYRATKSLELVHTDVCSPMRVQARGGYEYFVTFTDDYSRYGFVYLMR